MRTRDHATAADERGIALVTVMLLTVAIAAVVAGAIFLTSSSALISKGHEREEDMRNAADAGIELGRSALNGNPALFPDTGYKTLYAAQQVTDASGVPYPGVTRSVYYGPTGSSTGQYGIFGSVVSVITDNSGALVVRRGELAQESFARFAYFTNDEGSGICFGGGDNIFGPIHTNDDMCIYSSGARFRSDVEVSGTITGKSYGTFDQGYSEHGSVIPLPATADLAKLATYATTGGMNFTPPSGGSTHASRMRIEFVSLDLDGDGRVTGPDEGFFRVYQDTGTANSPQMMAWEPSNSYQSNNCGDSHGGVFYTAAAHNGNATWVPGSHTTGTTSAKAQTRAYESLTTSSLGPRCYLAGDDHLNLVAGTAPYVAGVATPLTAGVHNGFVAADAVGNWVRYTATPDAAVVAALKNAASGILDTTLAERQVQAQYLWPLSRRFNPNSKGVIYFNGKVAISGVVNARVTIAASNQIYIVDDLRYAIAPGAAPCAGANMLGLLSSDSVLLSDNTINSQWQAASSGSTYYSFDDSNDETIQGVILTLKSFGVENYDGGPTSGQSCQTDGSGRGCLSLTGGIIQGTRGAVGTTSGTGYVKRYAYDQCAFQTPPPYFPTTGRFIRNRYYEIDPVGFNVGAFFASLTPNH